MEPWPLVPEKLDKCASTVNLNGKHSKAMGFRKKQLRGADNKYVNLHNIFEQKGQHVASTMLASFDF
jgi:hypothetical protein